MSPILWYVIPAGVFLLSLLLIPIAFRRVVETNRVHIIQSRNKTVSYGTGQAAGNSYYAWPRWLPLIGITSIILPVNNFELQLKDYDAYDKERVPFSLDVVSFFRIADTNKAARSISNFKELQDQLVAVLKGAIRKILASHNINEIMVNRSTFGEQFTKEVSDELANWGVEPVKNIELMDIRDAAGNNVIANIMAIKTSQIEMESRVAVAKSKQLAQTAEIEAKRATQVADQAAAEEIGRRTAEKDQVIGIAQQQSKQSVADEEVKTVEKLKAIERTNTVLQAKMEQETALIQAERDKQTTVLGAEGNLEATKRVAEGFRVTGAAKAEAEAAMQLAPVQAQIRLAQEIGENLSYQTYLVKLEEVKASVTVGIAQAEALKKAEIKVIANTGNPTAGVNSVMNLFSPQGGLAVGGMLEALKNTPEGAILLDKVIGTPKVAPKA